MIGFSWLMTNTKTVIVRRTVLVRCFCWITLCHGISGTQYQWIIVEHWLQWITVENSISESRWNTGFSEPQRDTASVNLGGTLDWLNHSGTLYNYGDCFFFSDMVPVFTTLSVSLRDVVFQAGFFSGTLTTLLKITSLSV